MHRFLSSLLIAVALPATLPAAAPATSPARQRAVLGLLQRDGVTGIAYDDRYVVIGYSRRPTTPRDLHVSVIDTRRSLTARRRLRVESGCSMFGDAAFRLVGGEFLAPCSGGDLSAVIMSVDRGIVDRLPARIEIAPGVLASWSPRRVGRRWVQGTSDECRGAGTCEVFMRRSDHAVRVRPLPPSARDLNSAALGVLPVCRSLERKGLLPTYDERQYLIELSASERFFTVSTCSGSMQRFAAGVGPGQATAGAGTVTWGATDAVFARSL